jgi:hypothetical protein
MQATRICLNMIVRNEAPVIGRCLDSVRSFIDHWVIVDTGSSDGTQALVQRHLAGVPGTLFERPWQDFAHNRNEAMDLARRAVPLSGAHDHLFFIDADETLQLAPGYTRPALTADAHDLWCDYAGISYRRSALVAARLPWRWQGVVHEVLVCEPAPARHVLAGARIAVAHEGARSRDPLTYAKDAALLEAALRDNAGDAQNTARNTFYLAQSWRDAGELARSRDIYLQRAAMPGWEEEGWYAQYQAALLAERLQLPPAEVAHAYLAAWQRRPTRAEPLVQLARWHRLRQEHALALLYARQALATPRPDDQLFVEDAVYRWAALDEVSVAAWYAGARDEGAQALKRLLALPGVPADVLARARDNLRYYD